MKKVKYLGENGIHVGETFNPFAGASDVYVGGVPAVGEVFEVPDEFDHPRCEEVKESKKVKEPKE